MSIIVSYEYFLPPHLQSLEKETEGPDLATTRGYLAYTDAIDRLLSRSSVWDERDDICPEAVSVHITVTLTSEHASEVLSRHVHYFPSLKES